MIKIFIPQSKGSQKTSARGFWYSKDTKKTYYDYIDIVSSFYYSEYAIETIQYQKSQECIFFIDSNNIGNIFYSKDKIIKLKNSKVFYHTGFTGLKDVIKILLRQYEGLTVYIEDNRYKIEVFYA